jgi:hypothetical protein
MYVLEHKRDNTQVRYSQAFYAEDSEIRVAAALLVPGLAHLDCAGHVPDAEHV